MHLQKKLLEMHLNVCLQGMQHLTVKNASNDVSVGFACEKASQIEYFYRCA
jgi:hypothetical protein